MEIFSLLLAVLFIYSVASSHPNSLLNVLDLLLSQRRPSLLCVTSSGHLRLFLGLLEHLTRSFNR